MSEIAATKRMARQLHARATKAKGHNRKLLEHNSMLTKLLQAIVARSGRERVTLSELERVRDVRSLAIVQDEPGRCVVLELMDEHAAQPPGTEAEGEVTEDA